jgi:hypothetical protein
VEAVAGRVVRRPSLMGLVLAGGENGAFWSVNRGADWGKDPRSPEDLLTVAMSEDASVLLVGMPLYVARYELDLFADDLVDGLAPRWQAWSE